MKSLTEAQINEMLTKAWEDGRQSKPQYHEGMHRDVTDHEIKERREFFQKLIDEV